MNRIAILGAGTMGPGIAQSLTATGAEIVMYDIDPQALSRASDTLHGSLSTSVEQGVLLPEDREQLFARVAYTQDLSAALEGAGLVIEAVVERADVKQALYSQLDAMLPPEVVLASNTSFLDIFSLVPQRRLPRTVIAHWYAPAHIIPLVELCPNEQTLPCVLEELTALLKSCGKQPVVMKKFIQGYIVNRIQMCLNQEVFYLLDQGYCTAQDIDLALKSAFFPRAMVLGVMQKIDFGGLAMTANTFRNKSYRLPPAVDMPTSLAERLARGETGVAAGKGFYDYTGKSPAELCAKRDKQVMRAFRLQRELLDDPI